MQVKKQQLEQDVEQWFQIGKGVCQGCVLSPCLFNSYEEYIMQNARLDEAQAGFKIAEKISTTSDMHIIPFEGQKGKRNYRSSVQFSSVAQSCPTPCDPMNCSTPGLPVHHQLPEFTQTHVHRVSDAIQPSHPLSTPSPPAPNPSQKHSTAQTRDRPLGNRALFLDGLWSPCLCFIAR